MTVVFIDVETRGEHRGGRRGEAVACQATAKPSGKNQIYERALQHLDLRLLPPEL